jgi:hypothetical protein
MGEKKVSEIPKDWFMHVDTAIGRRRVRAASEKRIVRTLDDLPNLISARDAATALKSNPKTVADWMAKGFLRSMKIRGRRWTTPEWINDFIDREAARNG